MTTSTMNRPRGTPPAPRLASQLEEARQLRDALYVQIAIAEASCQCSVSMTLDDATALERLLSRSIDAADAMGAQ